MSNILRRCIAWIPFYFFVPTTNIPLHIAIRKLTYCIAWSRNTYSSSWCSCSGEKKTFHSFFFFPSAIWYPLSPLTQQSPTATLWKLQSVLCPSFALCFVYKEPQSHRHLYVQYPAHVYPTMLSSSFPKTTFNPLPQDITLVRDPPISATNVLIQPVTYTSTSQYGMDLVPWRDLLWTSDLCRGAL